jgi:hypothetical protein
MSKRFVLCFLLSIGLLGSQLHGQEIKLFMHETANMIQAGKPVEMTLNFQPQTVSGKVTFDLVIKDYFNKTIWQKTLEKQVLPQQALQIPIQPGKLARGYYAVQFTAGWLGEKGQPQQCSGMDSFGVTQFVKRPAHQVLHNPYRFGIKYWERDWFKPFEKMDVCYNMGMVWTREIFTGHIKELDDLGFNIVIKVERFPAECFDTNRYGPIEKWNKAKGVRYKWRSREKGWIVASVPDEQKYKAWLRSELGKLPATQNVFEIWNEPWNKFKPEDFATLCNWAVEVVREVRPNAIVGPNLGASYAWDKAFAEAGGFKGVNMVVTHPYTQRNPENKMIGGFRELYIEQKRLYDQYADQPVDLYATEFGWGTPPEGDRSFVNETQQAQWTVRHALALYAGGFKGFMPHVLGQDEKVKTDHESYFGFFRRSGHPKPVALAYANCANQIDGSQFVGDLNMGTYVGAMLFEKQGVYTLALWTSEQSKNVRLDLGISRVKRVDLMGDEQTIDVQPANQNMTVTENVIYIVGVSPDMAKQVVPFDPFVWDVDEFHSDLEKGRAQFHYPPRESESDMRWLGKSQ